MISLLSKVTFRFIFTQYHLKTDLGVTDSYPAGKLVGFISRGSFAEIEGRPLIMNNVACALHEALKKAGKDDMILITGSLYLVGEILKQFPNKKI